MVIALSTTREAGRPPISLGNIQEYPSPYTRAERERTFYHVNWNREPRNTNTREHSNTDISLMLSHVCHLKDTQEKRVNFVWNQTQLGPINNKGWGYCNTPFSYKICKPLESSPSSGTNKLGMATYTVWSSTAYQVKIFGSKISVLWYLMMWQKSRCKWISKLFSHNSFLDLY